MDVRLDRALGEESWIGWQGFSKFFSQMVGWTFPGEESGGIEASFVDRGGRTYLRVESVAEDGSPRDFYATHVALVGPDLEPAAIDLSQVAPGVYESPVASLESGAYAVRVTRQAGVAGARADARPRRADGGRVPAPGRERAAAGRDPAATGGTVAKLPADAWVHDLSTTSHHADLWPLLLVLALLLWPLDIALRRVSVGRRELAGARRWVSTVGRNRRVATRTADVRVHARGDRTVVRCAVGDPARGRGSVGCRGGRPGGHRATGGGRDDRPQGPGRGRKARPKLDPRPGSGRSVASTTARRAPAAGGSTCPAGARRAGLDRHARPPPGREAPHPRLMPSGRAAANRAARRSDEPSAAAVGPRC